MQLLQRNITAWVQELLDISPIVVIEGARQVGKSTLTGMIDNANTTFTTMDDDLTRTFAHDDPAGFLSSAKEGRLVIDEIQRCPELILPLKAVVDNDRRPGRFVLTGSANLLRLPGAQDSLAGRAMTARLHPFSQGELEGHKEDWVSWLLSPDRRKAQEADRSNVITRLTVGGYPLVQSMSPRVRTAWLKDYANRLVQRDASDMAQTRIPILGQLLQLLAAAPGAELVQDRLAQKLKVTRGPWFAIQISWNPCSLSTVCQRGPAISRNDRSSVPKCSSPTRAQRRTVKYGRRPPELDAGCRPPWSSTRTVRGL
ncbi:ATPase [Cutibacterium acnes JCM 18916]|nr:ATPase [Cutibacterium acnes JCM 18916]